MSFTTSISNTANMSCTCARGGTSVVCHSRRRYIILRICRVRELEAVPVLYVIHDVDI